MTKLSAGRVEKAGCREQMSEGQPRKQVNLKMRRQTKKSEQRVVGQIVF